VVGVILRCLFGFVYLDIRCLFGGFWVLGCVILCNCLVLFAGIGMLFCLVGYGFGCVVCVV